MLEVPFVGVMTTVACDPNRGNKVASTEPAPKSWWKSSEMLASYNPLIR